MFCFQAAVDQKDLVVVFLWARPVKDHVQKSRKVIREESNLIIPASQFMSLPARW